MAGCGVLGFAGVLNPTTFIILDEMATGRDYASALAEAQARGVPIDPHPWRGGMGCRMHDRILDERLDGREG
ncbi:MAG: hypothetical protein AB1576_14360 [Bacillota bacterium]